MSRSFLNKGNFKNKDNLIPHIINATLNNATLGEIVESIKTVFGEWEEIQRTWS